MSGPSCSESSNRALYGASGGSTTAPPAGDCGRGGRRVAVPSVTQATGLRRSRRGPVTFLGRCPQGACAAPRGRRSGLAVSLRRTRSGRLNTGFEEGGFEEAGSEPTGAAAPADEQGAPTGPRVRLWRFNSRHASVGSATHPPPEPGGVRRLPLAVLSDGQVGGGSGAPSSWGPQLEAAAASLRRAASRLRRLDCSAFSTARCRARRSPTSTTRRLARVIAV